MEGLLLVCSKFLIDLKAESEEGRKRERKEERGREEEGRGEREKKREKP